MTVFYGILLPFLGTVLGAGCVFFLKKSLGLPVQPLQLSSEMWWARDITLSTS